MSIIRSAIACTLACALLAITPTLAVGGTPEEEYLKSYGAPPAVDTGTAAALAQEDYYASFAPPAQQPEPSGGTPWLPIVLVSAVVVVAAGAAGASQRRRRLRIARSVAA